MSDTTTATPVAEVTVSATPAAPEPSADPAWLPERLERVKRGLLKELGVDNVADVKAALVDLKAKREAEKTAADKAAEALTRATAAEKSESSLKAVVSEYAARQMIGLSPEQKAAVTAIAGEDPALQLKTITALQPTWAATTIAAVAPPKAADTAPAANAPPPTSVSIPDHRAQYEALRKTNPFAAALYASEHSSSIYGEG